MRRGPWHQCGDKSQNIAIELLGQNLGSGVVISPRDLSYNKAIEKAHRYHQLGAEVLIDQQFYVLNAQIGKLATYPITPYRNIIINHQGLTDDELAGFSVTLRQINEAVGANAIIAPALIYEAGRQDIHSLNERLFLAARTAGDALQKPVYATAIIGASALSTDDTLNRALSHVTSLESDGWFFGVECGNDRIPSDQDVIERICSAGLLLAGTGKPLFHAFAGPAALLSFGIGATAVGIAHSQNMWKFNRGRWAGNNNQGGGGNAPARYFSQALWGTIIRPDETALLSQELQDRIVIHSPYTTPWNRWRANKHFLHTVFTVCNELALIGNARGAANRAINILDNSIECHGLVSQIIELRDAAASYQQNWRNALSQTLADHDADYTYLEMLNYLG